MPNEKPSQKPQQPPQKAPSQPAPNQPKPPLKTIPDKGQPDKMRKYGGKDGGSPPNAPSTTGKPSGGNRGNNSPSR